MKELHDPRPPDPGNDDAPTGIGASVNDQASRNLTRLPLPAHHSAMGNLPNPPTGVPAWAWETIARRDGDRWAIDERDATGEITGTAYRDADGSKTFAPGGKRGLIVAWPLAAYAGSSAADPVFVGEGASDTGAMLGLCLDAVGVPMAGHCGEMLADLLADRHAAIVADADDAGRRGAAKIAERLARRCASVCVITPPLGAKDARDAVLAGATREDFEHAAREAKPMKSMPAPVSGAPVIVRMSDVAPCEVQWVWNGRIPRGRITLLAGRPGEGKSIATMDWAARVTTGRPWPDGSPCPLGSVVLVAGEDDPADTIRPRLDAHGADARRVHLLQAVTRVGALGGTTTAAFTLADLEPLVQTLAAVPDCALVIVDPIGSFLGGRVDAHRDNEVRAVLAPLAALAQRTGTAILLVAHQRKGAASHADDLVLGSRAFTGIARSVLHLLADPADDARRLLLPGKMNLSRPATGLAFTIGGNPARVLWEPDPVALTADGVLAAQAGGEGDRRTERDDAAAWLREYLSHGPKLARDVLTDSKAVGFSKRTIDRAKPLAGVRTRKEAFGGGWLWYLETSAQERHTDGPEGCHTPDVGNLGRKYDESREFHAKIATPDGLAAFDGTARGFQGEST
jgi:putative DNA primase/helicase